jgi:hypothetical protein
MNDLNPELLIDLAKLMRKYDESALLRFAEVLEDPKRRNQILRFLKAFDRVSHEMRRMPLLTDSKNSNTDADIEKGILLSKLRSDLGRRSLEDLFEVAHRFGVIFEHKPTRIELISSIMHNLSLLPAAEIKRKIPSSFVEASRDENEYRRWVRLIMGKHAR